MSAERNTNRELNTAETRSVNEDSPGIETMPDITPEMVSPDPPQSTGENNQSNQSQTLNEGNDTDA